MGQMFEEVAYQETAIGALSLRRRRLRPDGEDIWEIKLDEGYLMSSQFVAGEIALATLGLEMLAHDDLDVVVGGLGLGYTAKAVLDDKRVSRLTVVELIPEVIEWHRARKLPLGEAIAGNPRCALVQGDFFAMARSPHASAAGEPARLHDAILVDIDHSTTHLIDTGSADFYQSFALSMMAQRLRPGGVFGLWSSDEVDPEFVRAMEASLTQVRAERIEFFNPYQDEPAFNIIYLGRR